MKANRGTKRPYCYGHPKFQKGDYNSCGTITSSSSPKDQVFGGLNYTSALSKTVADAARHEIFLVEDSTLAFTAALHDSSFSFSSALPRRADHHVSSHSGPRNNTFMLGLLDGGGTTGNVHSFTNEHPSSFGRGYSSFQEQHNQSLSLCSKEPEQQAPFRTKYSHFPSCGGAPAGTLARGDNHHQWRHDPPFSSFVEHTKTQDARSSISTSSNITTTTSSHPTSDSLDFKTHIEQSSKDLAAIQQRRKMLNEKLQMLDKQYRLA